MGLMDEDGKEVPARTERLELLMATGRVRLRRRAVVHRNSMIALY